MKLYFTLTSIAVLVVFVLRSHAQFNAAFNIEHPAVNYIVPATSFINCFGRTGNDVKKIGNDVMRVTVWDGVNPGLVWWCDYNGGGPYESGALLSTPNLTDLDVALQYTGGSWYAVIAYIDGSSGVYYDRYIWNVTTHVFDPLLQHQLIWSDPSTTINIDCDISGNIVIIWDNTVTNNLWETASTGLVWSTPKPIWRTDGLKQPDVCLYTSSVINVCEVIFTAVDLTGSSLIVAFDKFSNYVTANPGHAKAYTYVPSSATVSYPRIASPRNLPPERVWSVVATKLNSNSSQDIVGFTSPQPGTVVPHVYTDGSEGVPSLNAYQGNAWPAVTYTASGANIVVGWGSAYGGNYSQFVPDGLIALYCNNQGGYSGTTNNYMVVNSGNANNQMIWGGEGTLSLAGRDYTGSNRVFYSFYWPTFFDVRYKESSWPVENLRKSENEEATQATVFPNPFENSLSINIDDFMSNYNFTLTDALGISRLIADGNSETINTQLNALANELPQGMYYLRLTASNGNVETFKIIKQH
jgi:hypothetical protein